MPNNTNAIRHENNISSTANTENISPNLQQDRVAVARPLEQLHGCNTSDENIRLTSCHKHWYMCKQQLKYPVSNHENVQPLNYPYNYKVMFPLISPHFCIHTHQE